MPEFDTRSVYIDLKGDWPQSLVEEARTAISGFMDDLGHDGVGEPELSDEGAAYAYDAGFPSDMLISPLIETLSKGPAWVLRIEEGDEVGVSTHVGGPGVTPGTIIPGDITDPPVPLSRIDDNEHITNLRAAQAVGQMGFTVLPR
jgi:hypothetical protein